MQNSDSVPFLRPGSIRIKETAQRGNLPDSQDTQGPLPTPAPREMASSLSLGHTETATLNARQ